MMMMKINKRLSLQFMTILGERERKSRENISRPFIRRKRPSFTRGRTRIIAKAKASQTKAAEKHEHQKSGRGRQ